MGTETSKSDQLRSAFGRFATGITVVTAVVPDGTRLGFTVNSFSSVSLEPPLLLFSIAKTNKSFDAFCKAENYGVSVLSADQRDISDAFARSGPEKWEGIAVQTGRMGLPLIESALATFECRPFAEYPGGDHLIFIGEILYFEAVDEGRPLLYYAGDYL